MKAVLLCSLTAVAVADAAQMAPSGAPPSVWPQPYYVEVEDDSRAPLSETFTTHVITRAGSSSAADCANAPAASVGEDMVTKAIERYAASCWPASQRSTGGAKTVLGSLTVYVCPGGHRNPADVTGVSEQYSLAVSAGSGVEAAVIEAISGVGVLRGLETFCQLVQGNTPGAHGPGNGLSAPHVAMDDYPRFPFRGVLIDTGRHFLPLDLIRTQLDAMQYNKMNVLHWHVVDSQSFPFKSVSHPTLANMAYDAAETYSPADIKGIVDYARLRGVRVIPEFDTPGHTDSWVKGAPDLVTVCNGKATGPLRADLDSTYAFVGSLLSEVATLFTDPWMHLGGDEVPKECWEANPDVVKYMKDNKLTGTTLQALYERKLLDIVRPLKKTPLVWQEIFDENPSVTEGVVIDVWKGFNIATLAAAAKAGRQMVLSGGWYLDAPDGAMQFDAWTFYKQEPSAFVGGPEAEQAGLLLGGKSAMWGEHVDSTNFISRVWPRSSAVGERLWSQKSVNDQTTAEPRLHLFRCSMVARGIMAEPVGPGFCPGGVPSRQSVDAEEVVV